MDGCHEPLALLAIDEAYDYMEQSLLHVNDLMQSRSLSEEEWEQVYITCERIINMLMLVDDRLTQYNISGDLHAKINMCSDIIIEMVVEASNFLGLPAVCNGSPPNRPKLSIPECQLSFLLSCHFCQSDIAAMFNCSTRTIHRRIVEYGLEEHLTYDCMSDGDLDEVTAAYVARFPMAGAKSFCGFLRSQGIKVQRQRVRDSMARVDPTGVQGRLKRSIHRRVYSVEMPNSIWHIDGYHKLIRWQILIHGGIDGYSRLPVYIAASNNNRSDTVLKAFLGAVTSFGLPSRVRADKGTENVLVSLFMLCHPSRGPGRRSFIAGRSVHNQCIERFWRDLFAGCIVFFYDVFRQLEEGGDLDPDNMVDIFCLHFCFLPIINHHLRIFFEYWSNHKMRTCGNRSPLQLWIQGLMSRPSEDAYAVLGLSTIDSAVQDEYIELHSQTDSSDRNEFGITIPHNTIEDELRHSGMLDELYANIDPTKFTCEEAIMVYLALKNLVATVV